jgi:hypothetical protein
MGAWILHTSGSLFHLARDSASAAHRDPPQTMVAIVFAVAALEATANEIIDDAVRGRNRGGSIGRLAAFVRAVGLNGRHTSLASKLRGIAVAITDADMDIGAQPYQDFDLLLDLRNALIHRMPETVYVDREERQLHALLKRLQQRGAAPSRPKEVEHLNNAMYEPSVADWAVATSEAMLCLLASMFPDGAERHRVLLRLPGWRPPGDMQADISSGSPASSL